MSLHLPQFITLVVRPTLKRLKLWSPAAEALVTGTALAESHLRWLRQYPAGPARGLYQVEPATHADLWKSYLAFHPVLAARTMMIIAPAPSRLEQLVTNLAYATAVCRLLYYRRPEPLPAADDVDGLARYHKRFFNTYLGKADPKETVIFFNKARKISLQYETV